MSILSGIFANWHGILMGAFWLCFIVTIVAFVHEMGHYLVARACGVRVEAFAIGIGKEVLGFTSKSGVRWKVCALPIGGYVQMLGQSDKPTKESGEILSEQDKKVSFEHKTPPQKIAIAIAGPLANIVLSFAILFVLVLKNGATRIPPIVGQIEEHSAAERAGIKPKDIILSIGSAKIKDFSEIRKHIVVSNCKKPVKIAFLRDGVEQWRSITPEKVYAKDAIGRDSKVCMLGISPDLAGARVDKLGFFDAIVYSAIQTKEITSATAHGIFQLITGQRSIKELSGPLKIGRFSHEAAKYGMEKVFGFIVIISIGIGVMNLIPIPVLDGGHILISLIAIVLRREISKKAQYWIHQVGFVIVISLMLLGFINDFIYLTKS